MLTICRKCIHYIPQPPRESFYALCQASPRAKVMNYVTGELEYAGMEYEYCSIINKNGNCVLYIAQEDV